MTGRFYERIADNSHFLLSKLMIISSLSVACDTILTGGQCLRTIVVV